MSNYKRVYVFYDEGQECVPMEPNRCSSLSSTVQRISDSDPIEGVVACDCGRALGRMLNDPASSPFDRFSMRRPICAELLKNTCSCQTSTSDN